MSHDPRGMITRRHFHGYKPTCGNAPPPLHVVSANPDACHFPLPRPISGGGATPGPALILGGAAETSLGIDPTDSTSWGNRGYRQCAGMIGRFNLADDWRDIYPPGGSGVRPS